MARIPLATPDQLAVNEQPAYDGEMNCAFIWYAHAAAARQAGVRGDVVDAIREERAPADLDPEERAELEAPAHPTEKALPQEESRP